MSNCCIGLCVKDSESGLIEVLNNVDKIREIFLEVRVVVAYDNSKDASIKILTNYSMKHNDVVIINVGNHDEYENSSKRHIDRSQRIANARNIILDYIYTSCSSWEYFIMMDTNYYSCVTAIDTQVLSHVITLSEWDGLSFNRNPYYDIWALSIPPLVLSCWHIYKYDKAIALYERYITDKLEKLGPDEFLPVMSAFCGFAIYRTKKFKDCRYSGKFDINMFSEKSIRKNAEILDSKIFLRANDCEHRNFHVTAIKKNDAKIMVSPLYLFPNASSITADNASKKMQVKFN